MQTVIRRLSILILPFTLQIIKSTQWPSKELWPTGQDSLTERPRLRLETHHTIDITQRERQAIL